MLTTMEGDPMLSVCAVLSTVPTSTSVVLGITLNTNDGMLSMNYSL